VVAAGFVFAFGFLSPLLCELLISAPPEISNQQRGGPTSLKAPHSGVIFRARFDSASGLRRTLMAHPCAINPKNNAAVRPRRKGESGVTQRFRLRISF